jgi:hypothetical protein
MEKGEAESLGLAPISPEALDIVNPPTDTPLCQRMYLSLHRFIFYG